MAVGFYFTLFLVGSRVFPSESKFLELVEIDGKQEGRVSEKPGINTDILMSAVNKTGLVGQEDRLRGQPTNKLPRSIIAEV